MRYDLLQQAPYSNMTGCMHCPRAPHACVGDCSLADIVFQVSSCPWPHTPVGLATILFYNVETRHNGDKREGLCPAAMAYVFNIT